MEYKKSEKRNKELYEEISLEYICVREMEVLGKDIFKKYIILWCHVQCDMRLLGDEKIPNLKDENLVFQGMLQVIRGRFSYTILIHCFDNAIKRLLAEFFGRQGR